MNLKKCSVSALLCLTILSAGVRAGSAQQLQPLEPEWLRQMYAEGWQKAQEGVLRRVAEGRERETFSYGAEGMLWVVQRYEQQAAYLKSQYDASPSADLAESIDQLESQILRMEEAIDTAPLAESFDGEVLAECAISQGSNYDVDVYAGPQTGAQGVTANARAYFHNDCGILGDTSTTAEAHAVAATGEMHVTHIDPKNGGSWLDSHSSASANGSTGCKSYAAGMVMYPGLPTASTAGCGPRTARVPRPVRPSGGARFRESGSLGGRAKPTCSGRSAMPTPDFASTRMRMAALKQSVSTSSRPASSSARDSSRSARVPSRSESAEDTPPADP